MINEKIFLGFPMLFGDVCKIYPPSVNDVIGNEDFPKYLSLFTITQEDIEDAYLKEVSNQILPTRREGPQIPTPFQYMLSNFLTNDQMREVTLNAFQMFLHEPVTVVPELEIVIIGVDEEHLDPDKDLIEPRTFTEENYFDFQNAIRLSIGAKEVEPPDLDEDPRVRRIKAKFRQRDKLKAKRKDSPEIGTLLTAICCMGIGLTPLNIGEMSYACVNWLIEMYQNKEKFETDIRSLQAGADSKKVKPKYWIKNLD